MRSIDDLRQLLRNHNTRTELPGAVHFKKAAVAAVFKEGDRGLDLLLIRRAEHPKDPWSGHMAFPGGRVDEGDSGPLGAAVRETKEEIGLDLDRKGSLVGELSHQPAVAHGRPLPMVIYPFVFSIDGTPVMAPDTTEVQEAIWVPFAFLLDDENRFQIERKIAGVPMKLPAYDYEGRMIWGLTLRMIDEIIALART